MIVQAPTINLPATSTDTFAPYLRVKISSSVVALAGATDEEFGTLTQRKLAGETVVSVVPKNAGGTKKMVAAGAIAAYAKVYGAAGGKVNDVSNENPLGTALEAASADGSIIEVLPQVFNDTLDELGAIDGNVIIDDDFIGDYPAAGTALAVDGPTKVETLGLGVIPVDAADGILMFSFDAVAEAATAALYYTNSPVDPSKNPIFECILAVFDIGDDVALDINFGLASDTHATDFDTIAEFVAFHLDGTDLSLTCQSDDGSTDTAPVDTNVDLVDDTLYAFKIDCSDLTDVKFYYRALGATAWTRLNSGTTYDVSAATANWTPIVHVEKTSDDTLADVRLDRWRVQAERSSV